MTRIYRPASLAALAAVLDDGELPGDPDTVVATGEDEESEYDALMTAADVAASRLAGPGRRVVVVADLGEGEDVDGPVPRRRVAAVHADPEDRPAGADPEEDLAWFATQEIGRLLGR